MPRFYFDIRSGEILTRDEEGVEFANAKEARSDASRTLGEMIKDAMPDGEHCEMAVEVRGQTPALRHKDHLRGRAAGGRRLPGRSVAFFFAGLTPARSPYRCRKDRKAALGPSSGMLVVRAYSRQTQCRSAPRTVRKSA